MKPHDIFWLIFSILTLIISTAIIDFHLTIFLIFVCIIFYWVVSILIINDVDDIFWLKFLTFTNPVLIIVIAITFFNIWFDSLFKKKEND